MLFLFIADTADNSNTSVVVLSYPRYCRYRAIIQGMAQMGKNGMQHKVLNALGGIIVKSNKTRVLFCRDTFDYPELEGHELLCNHLAPKLKGRPRGKRKKRRSLSPGSESNESESSLSLILSSAKVSSRFLTYEVFKNFCLRFLIAPVYLSFTE